MLSTSERLAAMGALRSKSSTDILVIIEYAEYASRFRLNDEERAKLGIAKDDTIPVGVEQMDKLVDPRPYDVGKKLADRIVETIQKLATDGRLTAADSGIISLYQKVKPIADRPEPVGLE